MHHRRNHSHEKLKFSLGLVFLFSSTFVSATELESLAQGYSSAWVETQRSEATEDDLNRYLAYLTRDIGHQHLPYDPESIRKPDNRKKMLEGMSFYLGSHTKYSSSLKAVMTGHNLVVIKYSTKSEGVHPQTKETITQEYDTVEVLEIENGKVAVIRKYSE